MKHKWWHFVFGNVLKEELIDKKGMYETNSFWEECNKCGTIIGKKELATSFHIGTIVTKTNAEEEKNV